MIPYFHLAGAAIATGVGHLTMALLTLRIIRTKIEYKIRIKEQLKIFAAGIIMLLSMILLKQKLIMAEIPKIIVIIGCAGLIYLATLFILKFLTKDKLIEGKKLLDL